MYSCHGVDVSQAIRESCVKFIRSAEGQRIIQSSIRSSLSKSPVRSSSKREFIKSGFISNVWEALKGDFGEAASQLNPRHLIETLLNHLELFDGSDPMWGTRLSTFKEELNHGDPDDACWEDYDLISQVIYTLQTRLENGSLT